MRSSPGGSGLAAPLRLFRNLGVSPIEVFRNTPGKIAADIALVIDVMTELSRGRSEVFCIVSGDGDFNRLALTIRESGSPVLVFGPESTPDSLHAGDRAQGDLLCAVFGPVRPFLVHAQVGRQGRCSETDAGQPRSAGAGSAHDSGLLASGAGTLGTRLLHLARVTAAGAETARNQNTGSGQLLSQ